MTAPRRRWFRFAFSLRMLFVVVTVLACCLGWAEVQRRHVFERSQMLELILREGGSYGSPLVNQSASVGRIREYFGDEDITSIRLSFSFPSEHEQAVRRLFPEAAVKCDVTKDPVSRPSPLNVREHVWLPGEVEAPDDDDEVAE